MKAKQQVGTAAVVSLVVLIAANEHRNSSLPPTKQLIAYAFVFFVLSAFADFGVDAAGGFAILAMFAIILGPDIADKKNPHSLGEDALAFFQGKINK